MWPKTTPRRAGGSNRPAEAGNAWAMVNLGFLYEKGWGVTQDYAQARRCS